MNALVGYTGFVGSNLYGNGVFDAVYNSKNIQDAFGTNPDFLIYAGLRAEKYLANSYPEKDFEQIKIAKDNIIKINPKKLVLISTIDVFKKPFGVNEKSTISSDGLHAYGYNRYLLECWVRDHFSDALIIRLPGLFGNNIKKNFIYDFINVIPYMLKEEKYDELSKLKPALKKYYEKGDNGFYIVTVKDEEREALKDIFRELGFSALNFTDSRSRFQFYNLAGLWSDINKAIVADIRLLHLATEPISAGELYSYLTGRDFVNELPGMPAFYDYRTIYEDVFDGSNGYIQNKYIVMDQIKKFVEGTMLK